MTAHIIILLCCLLLFAYLFDISASRTRVPAVILLLLLGWLVKVGVTYAGIRVPGLTPALPLIGTVGLILIVLEGALELELNRSKSRVVWQSFVSALLPIVVLAGGMAFFISHYYGYSLRLCLVNVMPLCVISSSIAISAGRSLSPSSREFITYESSLSDILGVLLFNFVSFNSTLDAAAVGDFGLKLLLIGGVSFAATLLLSYLLHRIDHHIKFAPIILLVILIYEVSKVFHLPGLLFIMLFGLFIGNLDEFRSVKWIQKLHPENLDVEVKQFRHIIAEATFLIRSVFFLLFGFLIDVNDLLNADTLLWSLGGAAAIYSVRFVVLKITGISVLPALFLAPRGLITILLYFAIDPAEKIDLVNNSLVLQLIVITALMTMAGMWFREPAKHQT